MLGTKFLPKGAGSYRTMLLFRAMLLSTSCRVGQSTSDATAPAHQTSKSSTTMTDASVSVLDKNLICYNDRWKLRKTENQTFFVFLCFVDEGRQKNCCIWWKFQLKETWYFYGLSDLTWNSVFEPETLNDSDIKQIGWVNRWRIKFEAFLATFQLN